MIPNKKCENEGDSLGNNKNMAQCKALCMERFRCVAFGLSNDGDCKECYTKDSTSDSDWNMYEINNSQMDYNFPGKCFFLYSYCHNLRWELICLSSIPDRKYFK